MSPYDTTTPATRDAEEPQVGDVTVPMWLIAVFGLLFYWGQLYLCDHAGGFDQQVYAPFASREEVASHNPKSEGDEVYLMGKDVFDKTCTACHQPNGMGKEGIAPPLVGSEWVMAPGPNRIAHIALYGLTGPITVKGQQYNLTMPPWKDVFDDQHIAAVLYYVRNTWGNKGSMVKPEQVTAARKDNRSGPENAPELEKMPVQ